jgi:alpha-amylase
MGDAKETDWATSKAVAGINKLNNIYAGKGEYISNSNGVTIIERGTSESNGGVLLVNMQGTTKSVSISLQKKKVPDGKYKDAVSGGSFTVSSGKVSGSIGNTGIAVIYPESMEPTQPATEAPTTVAPTTAPPTDAPTTVAPTTTAPIVTEPPTTTAPASKFEKGDVNRDGDVNIKDATMIQKYLVKLFTLDDEQKWLADFDGDGRVSIKDATKIQYKLAGML